jgi:hypothetical protein
MKAPRSRARVVWGGSMTARAIFSSVTDPIDHSPPGQQVVDAPIPVDVVIGEVEHRQPRVGHGS